MAVHINASQLRWHDSVEVVGGGGGVMIMFREGFVY